MTGRRSAAGPTRSASPLGQAACSGNRRPRALFTFDG